MTQTRRFAALGLILALVAPTALAAPVSPATLSAEDQGLVDQAMRALQTLGEAKGRFVQTDPRGHITKGSFYLKRPGRARLVYDPPAGLLVVADGANVRIENSRLKTFESYPLAASPLSIFLARQIHLDRSVIISSVRRNAEGFSLTARDGRKQAEGEIVLQFSARPVALTGWSIHDLQGQATTVRLEGLEAVSGLSPDLFRLSNPRPAQPGRGKM